MLRYRITTPDGHTWTAELNPAGALAELERGRTVTPLGPSPITRRVNAVREAAELLAREDITDDQYSRATALMRRWDITAAELDAHYAGV
jgi:hypothetical protein